MIDPTVTAINVYRDPVANLTVGPMDRKTRRVILSAPGYLARGAVLKSRNQATGGDVD